MGLSIDAVIGRNLAELRQSHGLSQDDIAGAARLFGFRWNSARISRMERGESAMTVDTLMALCVVLSEATGDPVKLLDLLVTQEPVRLGHSTEIPARNANLLSASDPSWWPEDKKNSVTPPQERTLTWAERLWAAYEEIIEPGPMNLAKLNPYLQARRLWSLTDERNARKLDLTDEAFVIWCVHLWGQLMSQETEARAPADATAQKRGRITRDLLSELRNALSKHRARDES